MKGKQFPLIFDTHPPYSAGQYDYESGEESDEVSAGPPRAPLCEGSVSSPLSPKGLVQSPITSQSFMDHLTLTTPHLMEHSLSSSISKMD